MHYPSLTNPYYVSLYKNRAYVVTYPLKSVIFLINVGHLQFGTAMQNMCLSVVLANNQHFVGQLVPPMT